MLYPIIGLFCVTLVGFIAHRAGICLVRGVRQLIDGQPGLLLAILFSGLWVGAYSVMAQMNGWGQPLVRHALHPLFAIGGLVFGIGASINQGCSVSTLHQFARGNLSMVFTMLGWFFGWCLWMWLLIQTGTELNYSMQPALAPNLTIALFAVSVLITLGAIVLFPQQRERWIGISLIGLLVGVLLYIEPMWPPSVWITSVGLALFEGQALPGDFRTSLVVLLLLGMWFSARLLGHTQLRRPTLHKIVRHGLAGVMMGAGGAMALGGNDGQILMGLPTLSLGAITAVLFMLIGIALEQWLYHRGKLFYQKR